MDPLEKEVSWWSTYYKITINLEAWESGWKPHWQGTSTSNTSPDCLCACVCVCLSIHHLDPNSTPLSQLNSLTYFMDLRFDGKNTDKEGTMQEGRQRSGVFIKNTYYRQIFFSLLRSDLWWTIPLRILLGQIWDTFWLYSEIDQIHLSSEAQCVSHLYPQVDCHTHHIRPLSMITDSTKIANPWINWKLVNIQFLISDAKIRSRIECVRLEVSIT